MYSTLSRSLLRNISLQSRNKIIIRTPTRINLPHIRAFHSSPITWKTTDPEPDEHSSASPSLNTPKITESELAETVQEAEIIAEEQQEVLARDYDPDTTDDSNLPTNSHIIYSYFFIFLAALVLILILAFLGYSKRRRAQKARQRSRGNDALERDIAPLWGDRGLFTDRSAYLRSLTGSGRLLGRRVRENGEGLNELGEAPPAYKAQDDGGERGLEAGSSPTPDSSIETNQQDQQDEVAITIPLRTLDRQSAGLPKYDDVVKQSRLSTTGGLPSSSSSER